MHRRSEPCRRDITISSCCGWSIARQSTSAPLRHWNLRNVTLHTCLSITRDFSLLHNTFARLYNSAASPSLASSLGWLVGKKINKRHTMRLPVATILPRDHIQSSVSRFPTFLFLKIEFGAILCQKQIYSLLRAPFLRDRMRGGT